MLFLLLFFLSTNFELSSLHSRIFVVKCCKLFRKYFLRFISKIISG